MADLLLHPQAHMEKEEKEEEEVGVNATVRVALGREAGVTAAVVVWIVLRLPSAVTPRGSNNRLAMVPKHPLQSRRVMIGYPRIIIMLNPPLFLFLHRM